MQPEAVCLTLNTCSLNLKVSIKPVFFYANKNKYEEINSLIFGNTCSKTFDSTVIYKRLRQKLMFWEWRF